MNSSIDQSAFSRQSFLGQNSQRYIASCTVGIAGLGGGGSHIAQQLAHLGFMNYVLFDRDTIEESNLNRLVGGTEQDVVEKRLKTEIARRVILGIRPGADVHTINDVWQNQADALKSCDIVFGCVDGFDQRRQLEATTRRFLIPLIDIGMDVYQPPGCAPSISGQVILSMPGHACMTCIGLLNERSLSKEAAAYGDAGAHPQVVWSNGILASVAVGVAVDLVTDWSMSLRGPVYLSYRGNLGSITVDPTLRYAPCSCCHFPLKEIGPPVFKTA
jgi:molybdopterin-synthase adenylyltransferase